MNNYNEKHKLPLSFKYAEVERKSKASKTRNKIHFVECEKYRTEFLSKGKPNKSLVRLL